MDTKDQQILKLLSDDARLPMKTIAAAVGLARSSVRERIHKLETAGVIRSYRAQLADDPQSGIGVRAFVLVRLARTPAPDIIRRINALAGTRRCYSVAGETDLVVEVAVPDMAGLNEQRDTMASLEGVAGVTTMPVLRVERE